MGVPGGPEGAPLRLAELVAALSLGIDLGFGQPMEHVLRQCVLALSMADRLGLDEDERLIVYYTALLVNVGCHTDAHEQAKWFGDDIAMKSDKYAYDFHSLRGAVAGLRRIGSGNPPLHRFRVGLEFALAGRHEVDGMIERHAAVARGLADQLGLPPAVGEAVGTSYEQWDGKGWPGEVKGDDIPIAARISTMAEFLEVAHRLGGIDGALRLAARQAGRQFDPGLSLLVSDEADRVFEGLDDTRTWDTVIGAEPALGVRLDDTGFDQALGAIADFVDLKTPYLLGHSAAVAELVAAAGPQVGISASEQAVLHRAGLAHGLGRLGISNTIWDKRGALGAGERERVRLQPYLTERMLQQSRCLAPVGAVAVQLRERLDGSGYPRALSGAAISVPARVLAAADVYQALCEPRPHRAALTPADAATELRWEVRAGRLDGDAADAVLQAAGHRARRRREGPAGLTAREVEVLRLLARGMSSKDIAKELVISPKTARNHIEHIYVKIGATSRVTASLFAMQHGLLPADTTDA